MVAVVAAVAGLLLGGVVKGAIGLGQNVVAVPLLSEALGIKEAVAVLVLTNLITNAGQMWSARAAPRQPLGLLPLILAGLTGIVLGSTLLSFLPGRQLSLGLAVVIILYVTVRAARPEFTMSSRTASIVVAPVAVVVGIMQGATGVAGPLLGTYLNAIGLRREAFVFTIAAVFEVLTAFQVASLAVLGHYDAHIAILGLAALVPLLSGLAMGSWARHRLSVERFEHVILVALLILAAQTVYSALT